MHRFTDFLIFDDHRFVLVQREFFAPCKLTDDILIRKS